MTPIPVYSLVAFPAMQRGLRVAVTLMVFCTTLAAPVLRFSEDATVALWRPALAASPHATATTAVTATIVAPMTVRPVLAKLSGAPPMVRVEGAGPRAYSIRTVVLDSRQAELDGVAPGTRSVTVDFQ